MLIYYDGLCGLCDRFVRFVVARDRRGRYRFAPLQGTTARTRLPELPDPAALTTVVLEDHGRFRVRSDAALAVVAGLGGAWRAAALLRVIPRRLRDAVYDWIARHRFRWFGRREECRIPGPDQRERFLP
ncbi:MAG TPA: DCC1-like thiol-disulfide oxidoreductase family protein [Gemmatimonadales bacterium]|nr:DCC1-like thiol-disulfide oxidoreductase family protein [Gemmatimonadales bacterium]